LCKSDYSNTGESSFYYLMMAKCCFERSVSTRNPKAADILREIGRAYLANASDVSSTLDPRPLALAARRPLGER
jgi:hypothetical protein